MSTKIMTVGQLRHLLKGLPDSTGVFMTDLLSPQGWLNGRPHMKVAMMKGETSEDYPHFSKADDAKPYLLIRFP